MSFSRKKAYPLDWNREEKIDLYVQHQDLSNHNIIHFLRKFMCHLNHREEIRCIEVKEIDKLIKEFLDSYI